MARSSRRAESARIARSWEVWAAQNLLRGVAREQVIAGLRDAGVGDAMIQRTVEEIVRSPIYEAARPFARDSRRLAMHTRLRRAMAKIAREPTGIVRRAGVSADELHDIHIAGSVPVILTDVVRRWPAFGRWSPEAIAARFGDVVVDVATDRESDPDYDRNADRLTRAMTVRELVARITAGPSNDLYLIARGRAFEKTALRALLDEVEMPAGYLGSDWLARGPADERVVRGAQLWLGPEGTVTPLHHDTSNILFCQVHGRKRWRLIAPHETSLLDDARSLYAGRDPEKDDLGDVLVKDFVLEPGEALLVPLGWWHHVRSLDPSVSIAFNHFGFANSYDWYRPGEV